MVTVASFCKSSSASGLPTMFERPTTTAWRPASGTPACSSSRITPAGVQGTTPGRPASSAPRFAVEAVDVLGRRDRFEHARRVDVLRQRQLHQDAVHRADRVQARDALQQLGF